MKPQLRRFFGACSVLLRSSFGTASVVTEAVPNKYRLSSVKNPTEERIWLLINIDLLCNLRDNKNHIT